MCIWIIYIIHIFLPQKPSCSSITWREAEHICCSGLKIPLLRLKIDLSMFKLMTSKISVNINIPQILSLKESLPGKRRIWRGTSYGSTLIWLGKAQQKSPSSKSCHSREGDIENVLLILCISWTPSFLSAKSPHFCNLISSLDLIRVSLEKLAPNYRHFNN